MQTLITHDNGGMK